MISTYISCEAQSTQRDPKLFKGQVCPTCNSRTGCDMCRKQTNEAMKYNKELKIDNKKLHSEIEALGFQVQRLKEILTLLTSDPAYHDAKININEILNINIKQSIIDAKDPVDMFRLIQADNFALMEKVTFLQAYIEEMARDQMEIEEYKSKAIESTESAKRFEILVNELTDINNELNIRVQEMDEVLQNELLRSETLLNERDEAVNKNISLSEQKALLETEMSEIRTELENAKAEYIRIQNNNDDLSKESIKLNDKVERLEYELRLISDKYTESTDICEIYEKQIDKLTETLSELESALAEKQNLYDEMTAKEEAMNKEIRVLRMESDKKVNDVIDQLRDASRERTDYVNKYRIEQEHYKEIKETLELERKLAGEKNLRFEAEISRQKEQLNTLELELKNAVEIQNEESIKFQIQQKDMNELLEQYALLLEEMELKTEQELAEAQIQIGDLEVEINSNIDKYNDLKAQYDAVCNKVEETNEQIVECNKIIDNNKKIMKDLQDQVDIFAESEIISKRDLEALRKKHDAKHAECERLMSQYNEAVKGREELAAQIFEYKERETALQEDILKITKDCNDSRLQIKELETRSNELEKTISHLQNNHQKEHEFMSQIEKLKVTIENLTAQLEEGEINYQDLLQRYEKDIADLENELTNQISEYDDLVSKQELIIAEHNEQIQIYEQEINDLEQQLETRLTEYEESLNENNSLSDKYNQLLQNHNEEVAELIGKLSKKTAEYDEFVKNSALHHDIDQKGFDEQINFLKETIQTMTLEYEDMIAENESMRDLNDKITRDYNAEVAMLQKRINELSSELASNQTSYKEKQLLEQIENLKNQIKEIQEKSNIDKRNLINEVNDLKIAANANSHEKNDLHEAYQKLKAKYQTLIDASELQKVEYESRLQSTLQSLRDYEKKNSNAPALQQKINELEEHINHLNSSIKNKTEEHKKELEYINHMRQQDVINMKNMSKEIEILQQQNNDDRTQMEEAMKDLENKYSELLNETIASFESVSITNSDDSMLQNIYDVLINMREELNETDAMSKSEFELAQNELRKLISENKLTINDELESKLVKLLQSASNNITLNEIADLIENKLSNLPMESDNAEVLNEIKKDIKDIMANIETNDNSDILNDIQNKLNDIIINKAPSDVAISVDNTEVLSAIEEIKANIETNDNSDILNNIQNKLDDIINKAPSDVAISVDNTEVLSAIEEIKANIEINDNSDILNDIQNKLDDIINKAPSDVAVNIDNTEVLNEIKGMKDIMGTDRHDEIIAAISEIKNSSSAAITSDNHESYRPVMDMMTNVLSANDAIAHDVNDCKNSINDMNQSMQQTNMAINTVNEYVQRMPEVMNESLRVIKDSTDQVNDIIVSLQHMKEASNLEDLKNDIQNISNKIDKVEQISNDIVNYERMEILFNKLGERINEIESKMVRPIADQIENVAFSKENEELQGEIQVLRDRINNMGRDNESLRNHNEELSRELQNKIQELERTPAVTANDSEGQEHYKQLLQTQQKKYSELNANYGKLHNRHKMLSEQNRALADKLNENSPFLIRLFWSAVKLVIYAWVLLTIWFLILPYEMTAQQRHYPEQDGAYKKDMENVNDRTILGRMIRKYWSGLNVVWEYIYYVWGYADRFLIEKGFIQNRQDDNHHRQYSSNDNENT